MSWKEKYWVNLPVSRKLIIWLLILIWLISLIYFSYKDIDFFMIVITIGLILIIDELLKPSKKKR